MERRPQDELALLLHSNTYRKKQANDGSVSGCVERGLGCPKRATAHQSKWKQKLIGKIFVHRNVGLQPGLCCFQRFASHCFGGTAALAETSEDGGYVFSLNFQHDCVSGAFGVRDGFYRAFLHSPA